MHGMQAALSARERGELNLALARKANYFSPLDALFQALGVERESCECLQLLGACASSTLALGLGCRCLEAGQSELVIAGGYDALSDFVIAGFDALGALTHDAPRPFRHERDGLALGEGAGLTALVRDDALVGPGRYPYVLGFGASADAVHVTAPDREGRGVARAANAALEDAALSPSSVDWVSAHATATPYNDAAENQALRRVFERGLPLQAWKASVGHTLGAAGVLEALASWDALEKGVVPASAGEGTPEPELLGELVSHNRVGASRVALKLSAAFGGLNAALVLATQPSRGVVARVHYDVDLSVSGDWVERAEPALVTALAPAAEALAARADSLSELALTALARLIERRGRPLPSACAVIVGTGLATLEANERFEQRRRAGLAPLPHVFPATSPNLCAGVCSIAFGLLGPAFSVGSSLAGAAEEAVRAAGLLVAAADVEAAVVIWAEDAGPVVGDVLRAAAWPLPARRARAALLLPGAARGAPPGRDWAQKTARSWIQAP
ncbi:MAG: beta-ketoacyl synthase N-terminal-like domain-containing protein [Polyangiaceae bacterium]